MLSNVIEASIRWRYLVVAFSLIVAVAGALVLRQLPLDALPDVSDPQVIVRTAYAGHTPEQVEREVTVPLASALASTRGALAVRGVSMFGESFLYIVMAKPGDMDGARSRVLERLAEVQRSLPSQAVPALGPDASGVGWVFQYVLLDRKGTQSPAALRALQDYYLRLELQSVPGVAEVATVGGQEREFRIDLDPRKAATYGITPTQIAEAVRAANSSGGGGAINMGGRRVVLNADNRLQTPGDLSAVSLPTTMASWTLHLSDVATVAEGPAPQAGLADLDGRGPVVGGIAVMRQGENAMAVATAVKRRLREVSSGLPEGVAVVPTYDRSLLIARAQSNLRNRLVEEGIVVLAVCLVLLRSMRAALAAVLVLPIGLLGAGLLLGAQGIGLNIMSLGGVAIAVGTMTDAAIVMVENVNRRLTESGAQDRLAVIAAACIEVGPALFFSLLLITASFMPVLMLGGQEGRLFAPLAFTKTYLMGMACALAVTLTPALLAILVRSPRAEEQQRWIQRLQVRYQALLNAACDRPMLFMALAGLVSMSSLWPLLRSGSEFMPPLDEGDLLYMPTTSPSITVHDAGRLLRVTDSLIRSLPEVEQVFGKAGRADTATDPAPLSMFETTVRLKPRDQWRPGRTLDAVMSELQQKLSVPGLVGSWGYPIRTRIAMLSSGVKTPLGLRITGADWTIAETFATTVASQLMGLPGLRSATSSRSNDAVYLDISVRREKAAAVGLSARQIQEFGSLMAGAEPVDTIAGVEAQRIPVALRLRPDLRDSLDQLGSLPVPTASGSVPLGEVADIRLRKGPAEIRSEGGRPVAYVYLDLQGIDPARFVEMATPQLAALHLPQGCAIEWVGEYREYEQARSRLLAITPLVFLLMAVLLYAALGEIRRVVLILATSPFALVGGLWLVYLKHFQFSVAVAVGFIALAGVAAEFGVIMVLYLDNAVAEWLRQGDSRSFSGWRDAVMSGAVKRLRPKLMTVAVIVAGLLPIMFSDAAGSDVMQRIAAPLLGGMLTAPLLSMLLLPVIYYHCFRRVPPALHQELPGSTKRKGWSAWRT